MKILHVIPSVAARYGGPSVAIRGMAAAQAARGHFVEVATTDADGPGRLPVPLGTPVPEEGFAIRHFARTLPGEWKYSRPLARWLDAHAGEFDVVHVHALWCHANAAGCRAARRARVPYVLRPLGTLGAWSLHQRRWKKAPYYYAVERPNLRNAAAIHATSDAESEGIAALGFGERVHVVGLGVSIPDAALLGTRPLSGPLRLVFVGRLHPAKGIPLLVDAVALAVARGSALLLDVVGAGAAEYEARLRGQVGALGLAEHVRFLGHLEGEAKWRALGRAEVFVLPSNHENFGIAAVEAMACGCAVVISDQVGLAPEVGAAGAGRVVPRELESLASVLESLAADRASARSMGMRGRALASDRYSWSRTAAELERVYEAIGAGRGGRAA